MHKFDFALRLDSYSLAASGTILRVSGAMYGSDGAIVPFGPFIHKPNIDGTLNREFFPLPAGEIVSVVVQQSENPDFPLNIVQYGDVFVRVWLVIGRNATNNIPLKLLVCNYVTSLGHAAYPDGRLITAPEQPGSLQSIQIVNPDPGVNFTLIIGDNMIIQIENLTFTLTTSIVAGARQPRIKISDTGPNLVYSKLATNTQTASLVGVWDFGASFTEVQDAAKTFMNSAAIWPLLRSGFVIDSSVAALQADDTLTAIFLKVQRWVFPIANSV